MNKTNIYVISDSLGETGEILAKSAAIQFNSSIENVNKIPFVRTSHMIDEIIDNIIDDNIVILYTLVEPSLREYMKKKTIEKNIISIDVLGPILESISEVTNTSPKYEPGLNRRLTDEYFNKVSAVEFAVKYDDCKETSGILKADLVLLGVSRTSKTPLSMYLAHKNYKVTNIPLLPEVEPPKELFQIPKYKVFGLTNDVKKLISIRLLRLEKLGIKSTANYAQEKRILEELEYSHSLFEKLKCPVINVSEKAIEETATIIISNYKKYKKIFE